MWVSKEQIARAKEMDLFTYLERYEPNELVHVGGNEFSTRTHDSLKISNGVWHWFSRGIAGKTALDYLIHVKEMGFPEAVSFLADPPLIIAPTNRPSPALAPRKKQNRPSAFELPERSEDNRRAIEYLISRGIDRQIIQRCVYLGMIYESRQYHNVVFIGFDAEGKARYANQRGTLPNSTFRNEVDCSDKRYCFRLPTVSQSTHLVLFESAIDALSHASIEKKLGRDWRTAHRLSIGGVAMKDTESPLPLALEHFSFKQLVRLQDGARLILRFVLAEAAVTHGMELMSAMFTIASGVIAKVANTLGSPEAALQLPTEISDKVLALSFGGSIPIWFLSVLGLLVISVCSIVILITVYGRFFRLYMYTALAPLPLSTFAAEGASRMGTSFLKNYAGVCLEGAIIALACVIYSAFAGSPPTVDPNATAFAAVADYIFSVVFNMLILLTVVRGSERITKELMGLMA